MRVLPAPACARLHCKDVSAAITRNKRRNIYPASPTGRGVGKPDKHPLTSRSPETAIWEARPVKTANVKGVILSEWSPTRKQSPNGVRGNRSCLVAYCLPILGQWSVKVLTGKWGWRTHSALADMQMPSSQLYNLSDRRLTRGSSRPVRASRFRVLPDSGQRQAFSGDTKGMGIHRATSGLSEAGPKSSP